MPGPFNNCQMGDTGNLIRIAPAGQVAGSIGTNDKGEMHSNTIALLTNAERIDGIRGWWSFQFKRRGNQCSIPGTGQPDHRQPVMGGSTVGRL